MKAITIRQPWAHAIVHLGKDIENRTWTTSYRGEVLIHAAKNCTRAEYEDGADFCARVLGHAVALPSLNAKHLGALPRGGIVARARIVDVRAPGDANRWHVPGQYGFVLADVRATPFIPCAGLLNLWNVPAAVMNALTRAELAPKGVSR